MVPVVLLPATAWWLLLVRFATDWRCVTNLLELLAEGGDCFFDGGGGHGFWALIVHCCVGGQPRSGDDRRASMSNV
jgi:hypothetical protein